MAKVRANNTRKIERKSNNKSNKSKPMKIAALIMSAIQELSETKGSTPNKITGYINYASNLPEARVKRQVQTALKRGIEYGILRRYRGHYFLPTGDDLDRANRIAVRFARLPTPAPSTFKSNFEEVPNKKPIESMKNDRLKPRKNYRSLVVKQQSKSLPVSPTSSLSDISLDREDSVLQDNDVD